MDIDRSLAATPPSASTETKPAVAQQERVNQAARLLALGAAAEFFHTKHREAFASVSVGDHLETWAVRSKDFRSWIINLFYQAEGKAPGAQAVAEALDTFEARAKFDGPECDVYIRMANFEGATYIDLGTSDWKVVRVTEEGWSVEKDCPVRFRRSRSMTTLPMPQRGGSLKDLLPFVNVSKDDDRHLIIAFAVYCFRDRGPFPILVLQGEQGSAKSTTARVIRSLIDPSTAPQRSMPRDEHNLVIMAKNSWLMSFDNLSGISAAMSDALCRISTGGGLSTRELYSDSDEVIFDAQRPIIVNGIDDLAVRDDLKDRAVSICLPNISPEGRRDEKGFWRDFDEARPRIFGTLLDALVGAIRTLPDVDLLGLPRMADFAQCGTAVERWLEWSTGSFMLAYEDNRTQGAQQSIENDPVAQALLRAVPEGETKKWTATDWLAALKGLAGDEVPRSQDWPKSPSVLSSRLKRLAPSLRMFGTEIEWIREGHGKTRMIRVERK